MTTRVRRRFVPPPAPKTPKAARTRKQLLDIAGRLFIEQGYGAVSIRDIADAAGLTNGAVYGHFRSKGQLLVEVIRWKLAEQDAQTDWDQVFDHPEDAVRLMYDERGHETRMLEVDAAAAARHDPDVAAGMRELYRDRHGRIADAFEGTRDPATAAFLIAAITGGIGMKQSAGVPLPRDAQLGAALDAVVASLT